MILANSQANALFSLTDGDLGAKLQNLQIGQIIKSSTLLKQLWDEHRALYLQNIELVTEIGITYLDIHIKPVFDTSGTLLGANLTFVDITHYN